MVWKNRIKNLAIQIIKFIEEKKKIMFCKSITENIITKAFMQIKMKEKLKSIAKIQNSIRAMMRRNKYKNEYQKFMDKFTKYQFEKSFSILVKGFRRYQIVSRFNKLKQSVVKIQRYFRSKWIRNYFLELRSKTVIIQRFLKKYQIRKQKIKEMHKNVEIEFQELPVLQKMINFKIYNFDHVSTLNKNLENEEKQKSPHKKKKTINVLKQKNNYLQNKMRFDYETFSCLDESLKIQDDMTEEELLKFSSSAKKKEYFNFPFEEFESSGKGELFSLPIDIQLLNQSPDLFVNFVNDFFELQKELLKKSERIVHFKCGDSFIFVITNKRNVYSYGANDFYQLGYKSSHFFNSFKLLKNFSLNKMNSFSLGSSFGLSKDENKNVFSWGKPFMNANKQIPILDKNSITIIDQSSNSINEFLNQSDNSYIVSNDNELTFYCSKSNLSSKQNQNISYSHLLFKNKNLKSKSIFKISSAKKIKSLACGYNFLLMLGDNGKLFSFGKNYFGECGICPSISRNLKQPILIPYFQSKRSFIKKISCGKNHSIVLSQKGKVLTFGSNKENQIGHYNFTKKKFLGKPSLLNHYYDEKNIIHDLRAKDISSGSLNSLILTENDQLIFTGKFGIGYFEKPKKFDFIKLVESKVENFRQNNCLGKIISSWSKNISILYLTVLNFDQCSSKIKLNKSKISNNYFSKWENQNNIFPIFEKNLSQYISSNYFINENSFNQITKNKNNQITLSYSKNVQSEKLIKKKLSKNHVFHDEIIIFEKNQTKRKNEILSVNDVFLNKKGNIHSTKVNFIKPNQIETHSDFDTKKFEEVLLKQNEKLFEKKNLNKQKKEKKLSPKKQKPIHKDKTLHNSKKIKDSVDFKKTMKNDHKDSKNLNKSRSRSFSKFKDFKERSREKSIENLKKSYSQIIQKKINVSKNELLSFIESSKKIQNEPNKSKKNYLLNESYKPSNNLSQISRIYEMKVLSQKKVSFSKELDKKL